MARPGQKSDGCAGDSPQKGTARLGNNAKGREHPSLSRNPKGPKAS
ncbi:hypothetical protein ACFUJ0_12520 [Streptomyces sp. NPDC057242]